MNIVLWVLQVFLAGVFAWHGWLYLTWSPSTDTWHEKRNPGGKPLGLPPAFRTFIGICELLATVGLILPGLTGILPWLTPLAAAGLTIIMIGSVVFHLSRQENSNVLISLVLVSICVIVAYGRWSTIPISTVTSFSFVLSGLLTLKG